MRRQPLRVIFCATAAVSEAGTDALLPAGGAPVSKALFLVTVGASVVAQAAKVSRRRVPALVDALTHLFVFRHPGELLFGSALLYYFRLIERHYGSTKYGSYAVITCGAAFTLQLLSQRLLERPTASGMYPLIFANVVSFVFDVPALQRFSVFGWHMTDKVRCGGRGGWPRREAPARGGSFGAPAAGRPPRRC